jgi:hypothetical protein
MLPQLLYVGDQMPGRILFQARVRRAVARAALIEKDYAIRCGVEELAVLRDNASARAAVQKDHWLPLRIAALLVINRVNGRDLQHALLERLDWVIKCFHDGHHT